MYGMGRGIDWHAHPPSTPSLYKEAIKMYDHPYGKIFCYKAYMWHICSQEKVKDSSKRKIEEDSGWILPSRGLYLGK